MPESGRKERSQGLFLSPMRGGEEERVEVRPHVRDFYDYLQIDQIFGLNANFPVTVLLT